MSAYVLNLAVLVPLLGALLLLFIPRTRTQTIERCSVWISLAPLLLSTLLWSGGSVLEARNGFAVDWLPAFHIRYSLGVDGFSIPMVFLTAVLSTVCLFYSAGRIKNRTRDYYFFMLLLECFLIGVFCARDLFLFYVFFDATLIPMYFLIAVWGGENRSRAALKFILYTLAGSAALLIGILWVYFRSVDVGHPSFDMAELAQLNLFYNLPKAQTVLFALFAAAFMVKIPLFPFHTWLPDAYVEAPSAVTAMLAGAMGKMGVYGFLRLAMPFFPEGAQHWARTLVVLSVISIIYGALLALAQSDLKRLVAYSSISHMGFIGLGLASATSAAQSGLDQFASIAISGVVFEMFGHGLIVGGLFLLIGWLGERAVERDFRTLTGVMQTAPIYIVVFAAFMFASMAMPGLVGFWGELYVLIGSFAVYRTATALSAIGIVVTAGFFVWALQRMAFGGASPSAKKLHDVGPQELWSMGPLMGLIVLFGILPHFFLSPWLGTVDILSQFLARR